MPVAHRAHTYTQARSCALKPKPPTAARQVIAKTSALNPVAGYKLTAGGLEWAYRRNEVTGDAGTPDVLLLHGLGSSGFRCAAWGRPAARRRSVRLRSWGPHTSLLLTEPALAAARLPHRPGSHLDWATHVCGKQALKRAPTCSSAGADAHGWRLAAPGPSPHPPRSPPPSSPNPPPFPPHSYRNTLALLGGAGVSAVAPDWIGHGDSAKPAPGRGFDYSEAAFTSALGDFVAALDIKKPLALVVQVRGARAGARGAGLRLGAWGGVGGARLLETRRRRGCAAGCARPTALAPSRPSSTPCCRALC